MPAAVVAIGTVIASVGSAVASAIGPIVAAISSAVAPAVAAIGSVIGSITSAIGSALAPVMSTIGGITDAVLTAVGQTVGGLVKTIGDTVGPFVDKLGEAITSLTNGITEAARPILEPIKGALEAVHAKVKAVEDWVMTAFHPSAELAELKAAHPEVWAASDGSNVVFRDLLVSRGIITSTKGSLLLLPDAIETINQVATLKILADLAKGQASVADLLGRISEGKSFETAQAIALLSKSIVTTTVGIMDRVDSEIGILRAGIDTFDERLESELGHYAAQTKAEVLAAVTPRLDILGENALAVNSKIARLSRHIEDESWFVYMLIKTLTPK